LRGPIKGPSKRCYETSEGKVVEWECGSTMVNAFCACPLRHGKMVFENQTEENRSMWFIGISSNSSNEEADEEGDLYI
jgi:hypothetical protein